MTNLDHICSHEANATSPAIRRVVQDVVYTEVVVESAQLIQVLLQQNVLRGNICKDQVHLRIVVGVPQDRFNDLQHWGDPGATGDHAKRADEVGAVVELALRPLDTDGLADFKTCDVFGDVAGGVGLNQEGELAFVVVGGDGRVGAHELLAVDAGGDGDVLADGEAEDVIGSGKVETVAVGLLLVIGSRGGGGRRVPYIPTLWETTVVSASSKSWNTSGFRIVLDSAEKS